MIIMSLSSVKQLLLRHNHLLLRLYLYCFLLNFRLLELTIIYGMTFLTLQVRTGINVL
nr:MAG TPA: hypothetical protein [Bacteriophage sp.]